jgi:thiol-disulfide isomerase/thioredoxin
MVFPSDRIPSMTRPRPDSVLAAALVAVIVSLALALGAGAAAAQEGIERGAVPHPVVLETLDGEPVDLGEIFGHRPVLIEFWASWCHICLALHPRVVAAHDRYGDDVEFVMVAIAVGQDQARVRQHLARRPMPGRIVWDARGDAVRAFDAPGTGFIVILDADGRVAYTGTGADQDLDAALARIVRRR